MPLPRPARLLRQYPYLIRTRSCSIHHLHTSSPASLPRVSRKVVDNVYEHFDDDQTDILQIHKQRPRRIVEPEPPSSEDELDRISKSIGYHYMDRDTTPRATFGLDNTDPEGLAGDEHEYRREARSSPASLLGSKRIGCIVLPPELIKGVEEAIEEVDPRYVRQQFLRLHEQSQRAPENRRTPKFIEPEMAVAVATGFLPGEFAAVRNVLEEMERRLGRDWLERAAEKAQQTSMEQDDEDGIQRLIEDLGLEEVPSSSSEASAEASASDVEEVTEDQPSSPSVEETSVDSADTPLRPRVFEISAGLAPGLWAMMDSRSSLKSNEELGETSLGPVDYQLYHGPKNTKYLASQLAKAIPEEAVSLDYPTQFDRNFISTTPAVTMCTFFLSSIPESARRAHIKRLLSFKSPYLIIVDHARTEGWNAVSKARELILEQNKPQNPLHIVAPCPHDGPCPLLNTADMCGFSQRVNSPKFARKTKHSKRGEEDKNYVYLVVARGERPNVEASTELSRVGRIGAVGKEQIQKEQAKMQGKSVLREVEGDKHGQGRVQMEMVSLQEVAEEDRIKKGEPALPNMDVDQKEMRDHLRAEAYSWSRLVAPPMKKSGHVIMDVCAPSGNIERIITPRSHSKQGYYDARKTYWGDLYPHEPKGKTLLRDRGVKRLLANSVMSEDEQADVMDELFGRSPGDSAEDIAALKSIPGLTLKMGESSSKGYRPRQSYEEKKEQRKLESMRVGKAYKVSRPDLYDGFPLDTMTEPEDRTLRKTGKARQREKRPEKKKNSGDWNMDSLQALWAQGGAGPLGGSSTTIDTRGRRSYGTWSRPHVGTIGLSRTMSPLRRHMSVRPKDRGNGQRSKVTIAELSKMKQSGTPISVITAYDFPTSLLAESTGVDMVLVGDSLSQVALGHDTTTQITLDEMIHHSKAVTRGAKTAFVFADLPFGSFESSTERGVESTIRLVKEGGVDGVKIEGGSEIVPLVRRLGSMGLAVVPHLGLQPQRATSTSGYLVQGRSSSSAQKLLDTALELEKAGATMILLEAIPHLLAKYITERLTIPTIGIGAGPGTSGQVLVITDVLGIYAPDIPADSGIKGEKRETLGQPRFVRQFGDVGRESRRALTAYVDSVKGGSFPEIGKETYGMKKDEWEAFLGSTQRQTGAERGSVQGVDTEDGA